jgi:hypothetical protein
MIGVLSLPWAWGGSGVATPSTPTLSGLSPTFGPVGTVVTLTGLNLTGATLVQLGVDSCAFTVVNATTITATVPLGAVTGAFAVTTPFGTATGGTFTVQTVVTPLPTITSFTPTFGLPGTGVTITGTNFSGASVVALGSLACVFTVISPTTITATVPAGAVDGPFTVVSVAGVAVSPSLFDVQQTVVPSSRTLRWALEVFPATQPAGLGRVLLRTSRNAIVVRDVVDAESDTYQTPSGVTWQLLEGADVAADGVLTAAGDGFRGEVVLDPSIALGSGPVLRIVATLGGAQWTRDYPITISNQA